MELLDEMPMTVDFEIAVTDEVVRKTVLHLQAWADELGFDFRDTFRGLLKIKFWD